MEKKKQTSLSKEEIETIEFIRLVSHIPLNNIHDVLRALATAIGLKYSEALQNEEENKESIVLSIPYIGKLVMQKDSLMIDWQKHSVLLNELINVKRACDHQDDSELLDLWYNKLVEDLQSQLE